ncbi:unnamed protein product [Porites evermanni]|uniref:Uncharacterized protein n=1 Tax=Porites evermanni TaxID=104178 RepID=A0ABN8SGC8_9CNID|nr:unnamed protein product [Porites evermanni]
MGFSITSAVMGAVIIICYSIMISLSDSGSYNGYYDYSYGRGYYRYDGKMAILAIMLILGIIAFGAGIWAAICTCLMKPCGCCGQPQVDQQMYGYPAGGYVMTQMSAGNVPVAVPVQAMQAGAGGAAAQGYHQPMVVVPVSGAAGGQMIVQQAASPEGMATDALQQQQEAPSFTRGGYVALHDEQLQVKL